MNFGLKNNHKGPIVVRVATPDGKGHDKVTIPRTGIAFKGDDAAERFARFRDTPAVQGMIARGTLSPVLV